MLQVKNRSPHNFIFPQLNIKLKYPISVSILHLVYLEITLFFVFVFHLDYFHESFNYEVPGREDVKAAGCLIWPKIQINSNWISSFC